MDWESSELWVTAIVSNGLHGVDFNWLLDRTGEQWPAHLPLLGSHNVYMALAAVGAGVRCGHDLGRDRGGAGGAERTGAGR